MRTYRHFLTVSTAHMNFIPIYMQNLEKLITLQHLQIWTGPWQACSCLAMFMFETLLSHFEHCFVTHLPRNPHFVRDDLWLFSPALFFLNWHLNTTTSLLVSWSKFVNPIFSIEKDCKNLNLSEGLTNLDWLTSKDVVVFKNRDGSENHNLQTTRSIAASVLTCSVKCTNA